MGTDLLRDVAEPSSYVTVDRWRSRRDLERFRERFAAEYRALDARCERLTMNEVLIGEFEEEES